jgi:hypothetical protein
MAINGAMSITLSNAELTRFFLAIVLLMASAHFLGTCSTA